MSGGKYIFYCCILCFLTPTSSGIVDRVKQALSNEASKHLRLIYYKNSVANNVSIPLKESESILQFDSFDKNKKTVFYFGGYLANVSAAYISDVVNAYIKLDMNVIQGDYTYFSKLRPYSVAARAVPAVGRAFAKAIDQMVTSGLQPEKIQIVGVSLGGQLSGAICRSSKSTYGLLVGLDPAGPGFELFPEFEKGHANYTIGLHTNAGVYGNLHTNADIDMKPNGGSFQEGCGKNPYCSHARSILLWPHMLLQNNLFYGYKCKDYPNNCDCSTAVQMPTENSRLTGTYYFKTSGEAPYGLGHSP